MRAVALVAAAGSGERLGGGQPKALVPLGGRPLLAWCLSALAASRHLDRAVLAAPPGHEGELSRVAKDAAPTLRLDIVAGGDSRSASVANALAAAGECDIMAIHDAARPLVTADLFDRCIEELQSHDCSGVVAAAPATDTIKEVDAGGTVLATLVRSRLWAVQTPQVFRTEALRRALAAGSLGRAYDDAQLVEDAGGTVRIVAATRENLKVTNKLDLRLAEALLAARSAGA